MRLSLVSFSHGAAVLSSGEFAGSGRALKPHGKQYLVVVPGSHTILGSKLGNYVIAFTNPG